MKKAGKQRVLSIVAFITGIILLLSPASGIAARPGYLLGLPSGMIYIFAVWLFIIALLFVSGQKTAKEKEA
ncbi:MAG: hypothetical protein LAT84_06195 [Balneolia bacterium]|nr:hypothetical protein [Balneolia bacterium]